MNQKLSPREFEPVPLRLRKDGWTFDLQRRFIADLRRSRCVSKAARAVGMSRQTAYDLRRRPGAEGFAAAWDAALSPRYAGAGPAELWRRAFLGVVKPVIRDGRRIADLVRPDNQALLRLARRADQAARTAARRRS